jgi:hypothetical protein
MGTADDIIHNEDVTEANPPELPRFRRRPFALGT